MKKCFALFLVLFGCMHLWAQQDTLRFDKDQIVIGELKSLSKGVVTFKTSYSDSDFKIDWSYAEYLSTTRKFLILTSDGARYGGYLKVLSNGKIQIKTSDNQLINYTFNEIVYLNQLKDNFWDQAYANFDIGINLTKANNYSQFNFNANMGYLARKWSFDLGYSALNSDQDDVDPTARSSGMSNLKYFLPREYFITGSLNTLSNTEQNLDFRLNSSLGFGRFLLNSNKASWGTQFGTNSNREIYSNDTEPNYSWEGYFATKFIVYDLGDLSLVTTLITYIGLEKNPRYRVDYDFTMSYDLPWDFYINIDLSLNFDSKPQEGGAKTDYIITTGFGWKLDR